MTAFIIFLIDMLNEEKYLKLESNFHEGDYLLITNGVISIEKYYKYINMLLMLIYALYKVYII